MTGEGPLWTLLDAAVYLAVGLMLGLLLAVIVGRGTLPRVPDSPASLIDLS